MYCKPCQTAANTAAASSESYLRTFRGKTASTREGIEHSNAARLAEMMKADRAIYDAVIAVLSSNMPSIDCRYCVLYDRFHDDYEGMGWLMAKAVLPLAVRIYNGED